MSYQHPPPNTSTFRRIEKHLDKKIKKALNGEDIEEGDIDSHFVFAIKRKVFREVLKNLEDTDLWLRKEYKKYLIPDKAIFSGKKWIQNNNKICENLDRKRNNKLLPLMDYLGNHRLSLKESESLADDISAGSFYKKTAKGEDRWYTFVLAIPDFEDIDDELDMSRSLVQKHLKGMGDAGIIKPMKKSGSHGQKVYALGYYNSYPLADGGTGSKSNWFLINCKEMRQALMNFYRPE